MKNISIILPVHTIEDDYKIMLENALMSIEEFHNDIKVLIVCPPSIKKSIINLSQKLEINIIENNGETDFCSQINKGIEECKTEWFSILEMDDTYNKTWLSSVSLAVKENPEVNIFLPIVKDINSEGKFLSFTNESVWAYGFSEKQGFLDNDLLLDYHNYQISGGLYKTQSVKDAGSLKSNIKLTFGYELLLRLTHNGNNIMILPRIGYTHVNYREGSLFWQYMHDDSMKLSDEEVKFWLETAKKEFFFKNKREINYEKP